jgi:hypothetical protein
MDRSSLRRHVLEEFQDLPLTQVQIGISEMAGLRPSWPRYRRTVILPASEERDSEKTVVEIQRSFEVGYGDRDVV